MPIVTGTLAVQASAQPALDLGDGAQAGAMRFDKRFHGALDASSVVHMLSAGNPASGSAAYVAIERISGALDGRSGSFMLWHRGILNRGQSTLDIGIVPDSGSGALSGIQGQMSIRVDAGVHHYSLDYTL